VHGDFHLGQVMRTLDGWKLLDFEGEPARPLAERRGLDPTMKDVAGMLRSFDYAPRHLLADHPADVQRAYRAIEWADRNRDAFLAGYAGAGGADPRKQPVLLRAFETDKAVYEVLYEARNRPTWLHIPMAAIRRLAGEE
jgi:maltokinase